MTIYGPYYDVINQTTELDNVLNKIHKNHSAKTVLIRILPLKNYKNDNLFTEYTISKVTSYFDLKNINYEIRDER
ncbi:MAG: hypothetical protein RBR53_09135 [Desulforegulaceae bacterium]|nr:hypothetical protein [Desulforegulaceae bacterium]